MPHSQRIIIAGSVPKAGDIECANAGGHTCEEERAEAAQRAEGAAQGAWRQQVAAHCFLQLRHVL